MSGRLRGLVAPSLAAWCVACGSAGQGPSLPDDSCTTVKHRGLCEATVTLEPREAESNDEATTLEVTWTWLEASPKDVPPRVSRWFLTAREARSLGDAIDELGKSPCVVEEAIAPEACEGRARILHVEAAP